MKKVVLICLMAVVAHTLCGQNVTVLKDNIITSYVATVVAEGHLVSSDNHLYIYQPGISGINPEKMLDDKMYVLDKDGLAMSEIQCQHYGTLDYVNMYEDEDNIYILYSEWQKKTKTYSLYLSTVNKREHEVQADVEKVFSMTAEKRDGIYLFHSVSPDKKKPAFAVVVASKKKDFKGSMAKCYGEKGEQLWENVLNFDISDNTFSILDFVLDNNATAYAAVVSYSDVTKTARRNETLQFVVITSDDERTYEESIKFGYLSSAKLKVSKDGNVVLGGFYCDNLSKNEVGAFWAKFDIQRSDFTIDNIKFPGDYYTKSIVFGIQPAMSNYSTKAQYIEEYEDGNLVLLGEMRTTICYVDSKGMTTYSFYAQNISVVYADATGKINDFRVIKKGQLASSSSLSDTHYLRSQGFSYTPLMHNNKLYIFYNDAIANYTGKTGYLSKPTMSPKQASVFAVIVPGQPIASKLIMNGKETKNRLVYPLIMDDDYVLGIGTNKKNKAEIIKVDYSF